MCLGWDTKEAYFLHGDLAPGISDLQIHHSMSLEKDQLIMIYSTLSYLIGALGISLNYDSQYYCYSSGSICTRISPLDYDKFCKDSLMIGQIPVELTGLYWNVDVWNNGRHVRSLPMCR